MFSTACEHAIWILDAFINQIIDKYSDIRQDNADRRLMTYGKQMGLIDDENYKKMQDKYKRVQKIHNKIYTTGIKPSIAFNTLLEKRKLKKSNSDFGKTIAAFLKRPEISIQDCFDLDLMPENETKVLSMDEKKIIEMEIKYEGYIKREKIKCKQREEMKELSLATDLDYEKINGLKKEAREKLQALQPMNIESASRISGVNPTDIDLILLHISKNVLNGTSQRTSQGSSKQISKSRLEVKKFASL